MVKAFKFETRGQYAETQEEAKQVQKKKEKARQDRENKVASLRTLRLAKEATEKIAAAEKTATKNKKPPR